MVNNIVGIVVGIFAGLYLAGVVARIIVPANSKEEYSNGCSGWMARIFDAFIWPGEFCLTHLDEGRFTGRRH